MLQGTQRRAHASHLGLSRSLHSTEAPQASSPSSLLVLRASQRHASHVTLAKPRLAQVQPAPRGVSRGGTAQLRAFTLCATWRMGPAGWPGMAGQAVRSLERGKRGAKLRRGTSQFTASKGTGLVLDLVQVSLASCCAHTATSTCALQVLEYFELL